MRELGRRLWYLLNRSRFERALRDEMEAHRAMKGDAGPRFGNALRLREEAGDEWGWAWLDRFTQDVRFALRLLRRAPFFSATAMVVLALGVGVNLAAFQVLDAVAFSPLPLPAPERLVRITHRHPKGSGTSFSYPAFDFYRSNGAALSASFALVYGRVTLGDDVLRRLDAEFVSGNYFVDLGARPLAGRLLDPADDRPGAAPAVVLAEPLWRSRFGGDTALVGSVIQVNGHPFTLVGVVPDTFVGFGDRATAAWMPVAQHRLAFDGSTLLEDWTDHGAVRFYARLAEGLTIPRARAALSPLPRALHEARPDAAARDEWLELTPAGRYLPLESSNPAALALVGALVSLVLVAACMNLGLLILARTHGRDREFSIRLAVGASRGRIGRQLLTEHLLLGVAGAAIGCLVSAGATRAIVAIIGMPPAIAPHFTLRSGIAAGVLALVSSLLFGFTPVVQAMRPALSTRLRLRSVLVGVQVAAASVLLIVSGLIVRGVTRIVRVPLGFDYQHVLLVDPALGTHGMKPGPAQAYWREVESRVRDVPGVAGAAITTLPPFGNRVTINREGTVFHAVTRSYFATMAIPLKRGRLFDDGEVHVALVGETLARRRWPGEDPIGRSFEGATIVGVVGDARSVRIGDGSTTECYQPIAARDLPGAVMIVRAEGTPRALAGTLMAVARASGTGLSPDVVLLPDALERRLETPRQFAIVTSALGLCALLIAVTGLAGMVAFTVSQRTREIGVRMALGARPRHVVRAIGRQFATPLACGAVAGSALAAGAGTLMSRELFGVSRLDPLAHGAPLLLFGVVAALAALPSLRRALRVDPSQALRHE